MAQKPGTTSEVRELRARVAELELALAEERRRTDELRLSESTLRRVIDCDMIGIGRWNREGALTHANDAFLRTLGYTRDDLRAGLLRWTDLTPPEHAWRDNRGLEEIRETGSCTPFEKEYFHKDGSRVPVLVGGSRLDEAGDYGVCFMLDLTSRRQMEDALRDSETRFKAFMDNSPAVAFMKDEAGRRVYVNKVYNEVFRNGGGEVLGKTDFDMFPAEIAQRLRAVDAVVMESRQPIKGLEAVPTPDGVLRHWLTFKFAVEDASGRRFLGGMAVDVTEHKQTEESLARASHEMEQRVDERTAELSAANDQLRQEIEQREQVEQQLQKQTHILQSILDSMGDGVVVADEKFDLVLLNPAAAHILDVDPKNPEADDWQYLHTAFLPDQVTPFPTQERPLRRALSGEVVGPTEIFLHRPDRTPGVWISANARPLRDESGALKGGVVVFRDVTPQKEIEANLRNSEQRLQSILDNTPAIVYAKDLEGRYLLVNRAYEELRESTRELREHILNKTDFDLFPADVAEKFWANDRKVLAANKPLQFEETAPRDDAIHTYVSVKFPLYDVSGAAFAVCGISTDITERKRREEQLRAERRFLKRLLHAHERDRQLLAYDLHDGLIQDITGALIHLQIIAPERILAAGEFPAFQRAVDLLRKSIDEGRRLMAGLRPPIIDEQGVVAAIRDMVASHRAHGKLDIEFVANVQFRRLDPFLEGMIYRIAQEALTNVIRHSQATRARAEISEGDREVRIEVRDWGVGFVPSQVSEDRFGLQGIRKRVDLLGGRVEIDSTPGQGTRLFVALPLATDSATD
jgi:PAS domain S-box-containing protein